MEINNKLNVYLLDSRSDIRNMYCLNLLVFTNANITLFKNYQELLAAAEKAVPDGIVVYVDHEISGKEPDYHLAKILKTKNANPLVAFVGQVKTEHPLIRCYPKDTPVKTLVKDLAVNAGITAQMMASLQTGEYYPLPKIYFLPGWQAVHPLYIQNGENIEPVIKAGGLIPKTLIDNKEVTTFWVKSKNRLDLVNSFTSKLVDMLKNPNQSEKERIVNTANGYDMISQSLMHTGLNESSIKVANASIQSMEHLAKNSSSLKKLIEKIKEDSNSKKFLHSMICCFVGTQILRKLEEKGSNAFGQWTALCFFHDMTLENDDWIWVNSEAELAKLEIEGEKKTQILNHAANAAKILSQYKELPLGIDTLVKQHHGSKMGNSLGKISLGVSPLAILFIIIEEWVHMYLVTEEREGIKGSTYEAFLQSLNEKFPWPNFKSKILLLKELSF